LLERHEERVMPEWTANTSADDLEALDEATRTQDQRDARAPHRADRMPTPDEEEAADESATDVDPSVGAHYQEMAERGANSRGEGRI
jgi:hypothetical protein